MLTCNKTELNWRALSRHGLKQKKIFQAILFPIDFSPACEAAAPYIRNLAELTGGTVTLLHVIPWLSAWYGAADLYCDTTAWSTLQLRKRAQMRALAAFQPRHFSGLRTEIRIECGCAGKQIVDYAEHSGTDLIMLPSRVRSVIGRTLTEVLSEASCPVWTAVHSDRPTPFTGFHSIVCALSPDGISEHYVNESTTLGGIFGSKLTFVSALPPGSAGGEQCRVLTLEEEYPEAGLDELVAGSRCPVYVETGPFGHVVRHVAELQSAELVVINRRHKPYCRVGIEKHAHEILLEAPCPILVLPTKAAAASLNLIEAMHTETGYATAAARC